MYSRSTGKYIYMQQGSFFPRDIRCTVPEPIDTEQTMFANLSLHVQDSMGVQEIVLGYYQQVEKTPPHSTPYYTEYGAHTGP